MNTGLGIFDFVVIGFYLGCMLLIGWYFSRKTKTTEDYLLGGRTMKPWTVGLSLFATLLSAISYLAVPGEIIQHGPVFLCIILGYPIAAIFVCYGLIPVFMKLKVTSAYEILEKRLGLSVRMIGSTIFLLTRITWMALIIFLSAQKVIIPIMGWPMSSAPYVCAVLGLLTVIYTSMGGIRAVVITDVIQTIILFSGALLAIILITIKTDGPGSWWPTEWAAHWDKQPLYSFDPHVRATVVGAIIFQLCWWVCTAGSDQMAIQRCLATKDTKAARRVFAIGLITDGTVTIILAVLGFALLGFFLVNRQLIPADIDMQTGGDKLFPHFIVSVLPVGVSGLIVSALLAASMSSLSSGVNSACTVVTVDFMDRFKKTKDAETKHVAKAKFIAFAVGVIVVGVSVLMGKVPGNILEVTNKTNGLFVAPLFGLFFTALFVRFATSFGTIWGAVYSFCTAFIIAYWDLLTGLEGLSWQLIIPGSLVVGLVTSILFSLIPTRQKNIIYIVLISFAIASPLVVLLIAIIF